MPSDLALCRAVAGSYEVTPSIAAGDVRLVITEQDGICIVAIPGTRATVAADWVRDLSAWPDTSRTHPNLGECHDGCLTGAEMVVQAAAAAVADRPFAVVGHSLGGGIAVLLAAMMPRPPVRLVTFGAMRAAIGYQVREILAPVPGAHYRNGGDPVPDLPGWPYREWRVRVQLGVAREPCIHDHFIVNYLLKI